MAKRAKAKIIKMFTFKGLQKEESAGSLAQATSCIGAGLTDIFIGETVADSADAEPLPAIAIDEPTITLNFLVNNSPFAGREGKFVTTRQIRERLRKSSR
jgi:GTP-binding protein